MMEMDAARGDDAARRSRRGVALAGVVALLLAAGTGAAQSDPAEPGFVRPEAASMGEGSWTGPTARPVEAGPETGESAATVSAEGIQQSLDDQLVAGVARPRIDLNIEFEFNSAALTPAGRRDLDAAGEAMSRHFRDQRFILAGHTDASGPADYNLALSRLRAEAARNYLISHYALVPERLRAEGFGESQPIEDAPPEKNRRVVLELVR